MLCLPFRSIWLMRVFRFNSTFVPYVRLIVRCLSLFFFCLIACPRPSECKSKSRQVPNTDVCMHFIWLARTFERSFSLHCFLRFQIFIRILHNHYQSVSYHLLQHLWLSFMSAHARFINLSLLPAFLTQRDVKPFLIHF